MTSTDMSAVPKPWVDVSSTIKDLSRFFMQRSGDLTKFGSTVNQTFEAYLFASTVSHYREAGWDTEIKNPIDKKTKKRQFRLKFSTRGIPRNFSYAVCMKDNVAVEIRHQLKVATAHHRLDQYPGASICLDLAVIEFGAANLLGSDEAAENESLITFGEAKHMNAYSELVAGFVGLVHEMQPGRLKRSRSRLHPDHQCPFLFISGYLLKTAKGILKTMERRKLDVAIYHLENPLPGELKRHITKVESGATPSTKRTKSTKTTKRTINRPTKKARGKTGNLLRNTLQRT